MKYPHIEFAMLVVAQDQGLSEYPGKIETFEFDKDRIEMLLARFTSSQLVGLAAGEQEGWAKIYRAAKVKGEEKELVHAALDEIFESVVL